MIEAAVNQTSEIADPEELADFLRELADSLIGDDEDIEEEDEDRDDR
jgi:hypothetical protein